MFFYHASENGLKGVEWPLILKAIQEEKDPVAVMDESVKVGKSFTPMFQPCSSLLEFCQEGSCSIGKERTAIPMKLNSC